MVDELPKEYIPHEITLVIRGRSRRELRDTLIHEFLKEDGGYVKDGKKYVQVYKYYVEKLSDGNRVFLQRPAHLNKGMDFQVCAEGYLKFRNGNVKPPSHQDLFNDLNLKTAKDPKKIKQLHELMDRVWNCEEPDDVLKSTKLSFKSGISVEMFLKILKWLFIEQDMTYWSYDGRGMLKGAFEKT